MNFPSYLILECFTEVGPSYKTYSIPPFVKVSASLISGKTIDIEGTGEVNVTKAFTIEAALMDGVPSRTKSVEDCAGLKPFLQKSTIRIEAHTPTTAWIGYRWRR